MSKSTFEAAMASAGFNDSTTKISKTKLKAVMNEISDGIWGGELFRSLYGNAGSIKFQNLSSTAIYLYSPGFERVQLKTDSTVIQVDHYEHAPIYAQLGLGNGTSREPVIRLCSDNSCNVTNQSQMFVKHVIYVNTTLYNKGITIFCTNFSGIVQISLV